MRGPKGRFDFVHEFIVRVFSDDLHAKRILSLANGTLGVMTGAPTTSPTHEPNNSHGATPALLKSRSTCLIADFDTNPRAWASAWPINETARAAPVITPSVPLANDRMRLACKSSENTRTINS